MAEVFCRLDLFPVSQTVVSNDPANVCASSVFYPQPLCPHCNASVSSVDRRGRLHQVHHIHIVIFHSK